MWTVNEREFGRVILGFPTETKSQPVESYVVSLEMEDGSGIDEFLTKDGDSFCLMGLLLFERLEVKLARICGCWRIL